MARRAARRKLVFFVPARYGTCTEGAEAEYLDSALEAITAMNGGTASASIPDA
jgi:hypothetical protein